MRKYDLIIAGGGCSGLSLVLEILDQPGYRDKRILLIDHAPKAGNDRTWCFWTRDPSKYKAILSKTWREIHFAGPKGGQRKAAIAPYTYCMVRSSDFYAMAQDKISRHSNVELLYGHVERIHSSKSEGEVWVKGERYTAPWVFNSCFSLSGLQEQAPVTALWQHFKGWWIRTERPVFSPETATLMDFRTPQLQGGHFIYVLPLNAHEALVEYTVFSSELLPRRFYDESLSTYLDSVLNVSEYEIQEEEYGVIPMFGVAKPLRKGSRVIDIGTVGGAVKPTTGYAFLRIQAQSRTLARQLAAGKDPVLPSNPMRFEFYDGLLLHLLRTRGHEAARIFDALFMRNPVPRILRFLDEQSKLHEEGLLFATLPWGLFLQALWEKHFAGASAPPPLSWDKNSIP